jgi:hypothetical protein
MHLTRATLLVLRWIPFTMVALAVMVSDGCGSTGRNNAKQEEARQARERAEAAETFQAPLTGESRRVSIQELDQLTYGYADRYFMVISSAVDDIKRGNPDPVQRRRAHQLKLTGVMAMNDIVTSGDPYSRTLDLVVSVTLESILLIDENQAEQVFGDRATGLIRAIRTMRVEAWELAARVLTQEQLESLDFMILEWRRTHPEIEEVSFVKFDNFAGLRAAALLSDFKAGGGLLAPVSEATQVLKDWGRLSERVFWYSKRAPSIAGIEAEASVNEILAAPEIGKLIHTADQLGQSAESVPKIIDAERNAVFADLDARQTLLTNALGDVRRIIAGADDLGRTASQLTTNLQQTLAVLSDTLKVGGEVGHRFGLDRTPQRRFDIQDYANVLARLNEAITNAHQLALGADQMTRSPVWAQMMQDVSAATDRRLDRALRNICLALAFAFVLAVAYRVISLKLGRKMSSREREKP